MPRWFRATVPGKDRGWLNGLVCDVLSQLARKRGFDVITRGSVVEFAALPEIRGVSGGRRASARSVAATGRDRFQRASLVSETTGAIRLTDEFNLANAAVAEGIGTLTDHILAMGLSSITGIELAVSSSLPDAMMTAWNAIFAASIISPTPATRR